jgi:RNA polymerase sigma factor (sigma-70 family)
MGDRSDEQLLAAVAGGDGEAMAELYRRHVDVVLAFLRRRVAEPEAALDLCAETFAAVLTSAERFEGGDRVAIAWVLTIARHKLVDSLRRRQIDDSARRELRTQAVTYTDDDLAEIELRASRGTSRIEALLAELPPAQREAITARIVEERDYAQIAGELRCSEQVVRQRVHRGLQRLRVLLKEPT